MIAKPGMDERHKLGLKYVDKFDVTLFAPKK
jgi:hypothetical protein